MSTRSLQIIAVLTALSLSYAMHAWSGNTHGVPSESQERQAWFGDMVGSHIVEGCLPDVPSPASLTLDAFACKAYVLDTGQVIYVDQASSAVGPFNEGDAFYWLGVMRSTAGSVSPWNRHGLTHYVWLKNVGKPTVPAGIMILGMATVSGGAITAYQNEATHNAILGEIGVLHVKDFGADGVGDDHAAIQAAIDALPDTGGVVHFGHPYEAMEYTVNDDILVTTDEVYLIGLGKNTTLKAGTASISVIRYSASNGGVRGFTIDCNEENSTRGLTVGPEDEAQTTTRVDQNFNMFEDMVIQNCTDGIVQATGPDVGGADSGNWYNTFRHLYIRNNVRGIYMVSHLTDPSVSSVNRNNWYDVRVAQSGGTARANTGLHIKAGATNTFYGVHFEGIEHGTSPHNPPTAIVIEGQSHAGADNNDNKFFGSMFEANTRDIHMVTTNANTNAFYGHNISDLTKIVDNTDNTVFMSGSGTFVITPVSYTSTDGVLNIAPVSGTEFGLSTAGHNTTTINGTPVQATWGTKNLFTATAPNSDWGYTATFFADANDRGILVVSDDFDDNTDTGSALRFTNTHPHIRATTNGFLNGVSVGFSDNGIKMDGAAFSSLSGGNGTIVYCFDCAPQSNPCTGSSTGALALRLQGAWDCR